MIDIVSFIKALKSTWIKRYLNKENHGAWKIFFDLELQNCGGEALLTGNLDRRDQNFDLDSETLEAWSKIIFEPEVASKEDFLSHPLWYNSLVRMENRPVLFREWFQKDVTKVKHLMDDSLKIPFA